MTAQPSLVVRTPGVGIGVRLDGVRLGGDLSADVVTGIRTALLARKLVFISGQAHLDDT